MRFFVLLTTVLTTCATSLFAQLPQISLTGNFNDTLSAGRMQIVNEHGDTATFAIQAKWRGAWAKTLTKKSFSVKLYDEQGEKLDSALLGMRSDNTWALDAMAVDKARMRNRVSFDLWNDFAADNYIKREYNGASFNGIHGRFVEVTLNGDYQGLYNFTEKIDRKQLKLKKVKGDGTIRGLLYKAVGFVGTNFGRCDDYDNASPTWMSWESKYPDTEEDGATDYGPLAEAIQFIMNASTSDFCEHVDEVFDLPVWSDYFLFINVIYAVDNYCKNTYAYIYDETKTHKLSIAPWDLDATWGRSYDASETEANGTLIYHHLYRRLNAEYPDFMEHMAAHYFELRKTLFAADSLKRRFTDYYDQLAACGAIEREETRWQGVDGLTLNIREEMDYISDYIDKHLAFEDQLLGNYATGIQEITPYSTPTDDAYYSPSGLRVTGQPTQPGIYIHQGKKVVVR